MLTDASLRVGRLVELGRAPAHRRPGRLSQQPTLPLRVRLFRRCFWLPAVQAAGLDGLRIHDLRHTAVALWIAAGANPKEVAAWAGNAPVSFTLDRYGHLYPDADLNLRERLDAIWTAREADGNGLPPQRGPQQNPRGCVVPSGR